MIDDFEVTHGLSGYWGSFRSRVRVANLPTRRLRGKLPRFPRAVDPGFGFVTLEVGEYAAKPSGSALDLRCLT